MAIENLSNRYSNSVLVSSYSRNLAAKPRQLILDPLFVKRMPLWKRAIDIAGSLFGLIMMSPLLIGISLYIKWVSPGPVFFRQRRIGSGGKAFYLFKFRTMHHNADSIMHKKYLAQLIKSSEDNRHTGKPMQKLQQDPRIIKHGQFLRASGLDELPQLVNVLLGEMSLIGPRPPIPYEVEQYKLWFRGRFDVVPGLTGLWQVSGKNRLGFNEMIRLDIQYAQKRSLMLDRKILLKTPFAVYEQIKDMRENCRS
jgi:lipopolysaccharide/colanic/teichoic acid biosynthesis glycosyltransferase